MTDSPPVDPIAGFADWLVADGARANTRRAYIGCVRRSEQAAGSPEAMRAWAIEQIAGAPRGTAGQVKAAVRSWFKYRGWDEPTFPRGRRATRRVRQPLTDAQLDTYYRRVKHGRMSPQVRTILRILPRTGLRVEEACHLRRRELQRRGRGWQLRVTGKGGHERVVPLSKEAARILTLYVEQHWREATRDHPLFPGLLSDARRGERDESGEPWLSPPLRPETVRKVLRRIRKSSPITPHVLRHTWATRAYQAGVDLLVIKDALGHTDLSTTAIYVRASDRQLRAAVEAAERGS